MLNTLSRFSAALGCAALLAASGTASADALAVVPPIGHGPYAVACANLSQDFARVAAGETAQQYWEGFPNGGRQRSISDLLLDPAHTFSVNVQVPNDGELYGRFSGSTFGVVSLICYPTVSTNPRPDYPLPSGASLPHMQVDGEAPLWPDATTRFPVLLFSHGLSGSPISGDYTQAIVEFASHGYVVVAPFHADPRIADIDLGGLTDIAYALLHFNDYIALQTLRPLELRATLDRFLVEPSFRDRIDASKVGAFGASIGGESVLLLGGATLRTTLGPNLKALPADPRIKAAVGYVPYFGLSVLPAFGSGQQGLDDVTLPYLAISGTADTTAPIGPVRDGMHRLRSTHQLVALQGVQHGWAVAFSDDIFTWSLSFLGGQLSGDPVQRAKSARMTVVAGGGNDRLEQDYVAPSTPLSDERRVVEYYNPSLMHFFITAEPAEAAMLDAGVVVPGWVRTGYDFKVRPPGDPRGAAACRFFGTPGIGPNSHFFTIDAAECAKVKNDPFWTYESLAFNADLPINAECAADRVPVIRLYNNGMGGEANHRYLTSHSEIGDMVGGGWILEGPVFCAIP